MEKRRIDAFIETPVVINGRKMIRRDPIECYEIIETEEEKNKDKKN
ncbi:MAG: hypothetical protein LBM13_06635 [Candidatus Ancillula sp.]|jgi:hypothetical protein|nr:hypothetical protein [Candidatus Ancillula sp.]